MSFPPPPGLPQPPRPSSAQSQPHASLPPRPPTSSFNQPGAPGTSSGNYNAGGRGTPAGGYNTFTSFQPRAVATSQPFRPHSPAVSASPAPQTTTYSSGYQYPHQQPQPQHNDPASQYQQQYGQNYYSQQSSAPQIRNPFPAPRQDSATPSAYGAGSGRGYNRHGEPALDPETEAQIAQWQSAYMGKEAEANQAPTAGKGANTRREGAQAATGANTGPVGNAQRFYDSSSTSTPPSGAQTTTGASSAPAAAAAPADPATAGKTVVRSGGGQTWTDPTLLEWDPAHFRLFAGNLAGEVTDDSLLKAFAKYPSVQKARVIRDKRTEKSKGYGFVSFSDGDDYFLAAREMQGKYIGSHPVLLRRAMTEIRPVSTKAGSKGGKKGGGHASGSGAGGGKGGKGGGGGGGKVSEGGVQKKQGKTKGGLRVLG